MMLWTQFKILFPSFAGHWVLTVALAMLAWYGWTRVYRQFTFRWEGPMMIGTALSIYVSAGQLFGLYGSALVQTFIAQNTPQSQQGAQQSAPMDPMLQLKVGFIEKVRDMIQNPNKITPESKKELFASSAKLFPNGKKDQDLYAKSIQEVYSCQRLFWEDALASFKAKQPIKSDERTQCEARAGTFFNREKLVPTEDVKAREETLAAVAARKRMPASDGKTVELNEQMLRDAMDAQARALTTIQKIFE